MRGQIEGQFQSQTRGISSKCIRVYFECDYQMYLDNGSDITNVNNFVTSIFNEVATIYDNDSITTLISEINTWVVPDPYLSYTSSLDCLSAFQSTRTSFNGNIAHLLSTRSINVGGVAFLDILCNSSYSHGYSNIHNSFNPFPAYSWTVMVVTHEIGHNLGSNHTQWCGWTGGALDNCYTTEGGCAPGPAPVNGGTIMSYCHLAAYGINFANGFGTQPGDRIRSIVNGSACLSSCNCYPDVYIFASPSPTICIGNNVTYTATPYSGGLNPVYNWMKNGTSTGITTESYSTSFLADGDEITCSMTSSDQCAGGQTVTSNAIIMSVDNFVVPAISLSTQSTTICPGESVTFNAIFVNGGLLPAFQWKVNGVTMGFNQSAFSPGVLADGDVVTCVFTSNLSCANPSSVTSNPIAMTISSTLTPSLSISTPSTIICQGALSTFTAISLYGGSLPFYQWKVNGLAVGSNSSIFSTTALNNGDIVSCDLASNSSCATPIFATSNSISVTVNGIGVIPGNGLLAWYPFNGNANDNSGNNFNGVADGAVLSKDRFGIDNNSYTFNGARDQVQVGSPQNLNTISTGLTVSSWVFLGRTILRSSIGFKVEI
ncbi:MAG: hypothetical protein IPQ03_11660 [Bacteroidetes bacterium]|nr:hypothetical protein [Bacteroidota bacterium]